MTLSYDGGKTLDMPVMSGTLGPDVVDIRTFAKTGMFTLTLASWRLPPANQHHLHRRRPGQLYYRGYPIEQLAEHSDFLESCCLLLNGELPTAAQFAEFDRKIMRHNMLERPDHVVLQGLPPRRPPDGRDGGCGRRAVRLLP